MTALHCYTQLCMVGWKLYSVFLYLKANHSQISTLYSLLATLKIQFFISIHSVPPLIHPENTVVHFTSQRSTLDWLLFTLKIQLLHLNSLKMHFTLNIQFFTLIHSYPPSIHSFHSHIEIFTSIHPSKNILLTSCSTEITSWTYIFRQSSIGR